MNTYHIKRKPKIRFPFLFFKKNYNFAIIIEKKEGENMKKPVIAYIAGLTAPKGRVMGHAGAIVSAYGESAVEKVELLKECGVTISKNPSVMGETVKLVLNGKKN